MNCIIASASRNASWVLKKSSTTPPLITLPNGAHLRLPSPGHLVTHLIVHPQVRHTYDERIWRPLRAACMICSVSRRYTPSEIDWPEIHQRFRAAGQLTTLKLQSLAS